jgi:TM2 domain-containing membrane protein YozV
MSFGRKGAADNAALAERRAAFLAAERSRLEQAERGDGPASSGAAFVREKSMGTAYVLWFFLGGLSAHRFYTGHLTSAMIQATLWPLTWGLILAGSLAAFLTMAASGLWLLADAFLIPGLVKDANRRIRGLAATRVFA